REAGDKQASQRDHEVNYEDNGNILDNSITITSSSTSTSTVQQQFRPPSYDRSFDADDEFNDKKSSTASSSSSSIQPQHLPHKPSSSAAASPINTNTISILVPPNPQPPTPEKLNQIQKAITDPQKLAYTGLVSLLCTNHIRNRFHPTPTTKSSTTTSIQSTSYHTFTNHLLQMLFISLDISNEEREMIYKMDDINNGILPEDLARVLVVDAERVKMEVMEREVRKQRLEQEALDLGVAPPATGTNGGEMGDEDDGEMQVAYETPTDVRYVVLTHFILMAIVGMNQSQNQPSGGMAVVGGGVYDSRSRTLIRRVAELLDISFEDFVAVECGVVEWIRRGL
ncbi:hypothetical protein HDU76_011905, partial [Blyttiomyces sp. JEL0837]